MLYKTTSMAFAAYLIVTRNLPFIRMELQRKKLACFVFEDLADMGEELHNKFITGQTTVDPAAFHAQLRVLRNTIDQKIAAATSDSGAVHDRQ